MAYITGKDAAYIEPKLVPDYELLGRDDSGGPEWDSYSAQFGDGKFKRGEKAHLSAAGGKDDEMKGDEVSKKLRRSNKEEDAPAASKKMAKE